MKPENESVLLRSLQQGSISAFDTIYNYYFKLLYLEAYYKIRNHEEATDIVQDIFGDLWHKHDQINITISLKAYLYKAVHFQYSSRLRKKANHHKYLSNLNLPEAECNTTIALERKERAVNMQQLIEKIPSERNRSAVKYFYLHQLTYKELARLMAIDTRAIRIRSSRGIQALRHLLKKRGRGHLPRF